MPNYSNTTPPNSLSPGDVGFSFNNENPAAPQAGTQFAIARPYGVDDPPSVGVDIRFAVAPTAVQMDIQASIDDVDANYNTVYSSTRTSGEHVNVVNLKARFLRARLVSQTGGSGVTVEFLG
ncbi:MAG: hypothetical protein DMG29_00895 [Acidobacteria bacterium]|nr:MAG: hypothetical protein DMG29_00895 [Acidobacteriota bacterium]